MAPPNGPVAAGAGAAAGLPTVEQILEPSPGVLLRRRIFGHAGITIGATPEGQQFSEYEPIIREAGKSGLDD